MGPLTQLLLQSQTDLLAPQLKTSNDQEAFSFCGSKVWNELEHEVKLALSLSTFNCRLKRFKEFQMNELMNAFGATKNRNFTFFFNLDQALIIHIIWPRLCQPTHCSFKPKSHFFKLALACCKLNFFLKRIIRDKSLVPK